MQVADRAPAPARDHRVFWWKEALIVSVFYAVYSWTRNQFGSNEIAADGVPEQAFTNAERIIDLERRMGLYLEEHVQDLFLPYDWFIQFWNTFYGTAHFFVTLGVFILLFVKRRDVFPQWRNTLAAMTALAIIGFAWFPLMPPRLLDEPCPAQVEGAFGGACIPSDLRGADGFGYVDTLAEYGGPWSFESETVASISNQYAAMPSLHIGWASWCAIAVWPLVRRRWVKVAVLLYPLATLFCIVVTANHYWIDGVGGLIVFGVGALIGWGLHRWNQDRLDRRFAQRRPTAAERPLGPADGSLGEDGTGDDGVSEPRVTPAARDGVHDAADGDAGGDGRGDGEGDGPVDDRRAAGHEPATATGGQPDPEASATPDGGDADPGAVSRVDVD